MNERLYRSTQDRVLAGVCGGIAERFDLDPSLVRVGFVVLGIVTAIFPFVFIYVVMAIVVPESPIESIGAVGATGAGGAAAQSDGPSGAGTQAGATPATEDHSATGRRHHRERDRTGAVVFGGLLIIVGITFAIRQYIQIDWNQVWPLLLIGFGLVLVVVSVIPRGVSR